MNKSEKKRRVKDDNFGEIMGYNLQEFDEPRLAELDFSEGEITFSSYEKLDKFIDEKFIPTYIKINKNRYGKNTQKRPYASIALNHILHLNLSELEIKHVIDYLKDKGIRVTGKSQNYDSEFSNYDYIIRYTNLLNKYIDSLYREKLKPEEMMQKFIEFYKTKNKDLREELILRNYKLALSFAWKYALKYDIDFDDIKEYGFEGLIYAVDNFNPYYKGKNDKANFSTYAGECIKGIIKRRVREFQKNMIQAPVSVYESFNKAKVIVEKKYGEKFENNPEMIDDILDIMIEYYRYNPKNRNAYRVLFSSTKSFEELDKELDTLKEEVDFESNINNEMLAMELKEAISMLTPAQRRVINLRFGLNGKKALTQDAVARLLGISQTRVRQLEQKALQKLRLRSSNIEKLESFLDEDYDNKKEQRSSKDEKEKGKKGKKK